jgi:hypothetical protein
MVAWPKMAVVEMKMRGPITKVIIITNYKSNLGKK